MSVTRRTVHALIVMVCSVAIAFVVLHLVPGDPLSIMIEQSGRTPEARALLREHYGLDANIPTQLVRFISNVARGDFGTSLGNGRAVSELLADAAWNSILLASAGLTAASCIGLIVGSANGWWPRARTARAAGHALDALYAVPEFILAIGLLIVFGYHAHWFPLGGLADPRVALSGTALERAIDVVRHLALPMTTLGLGWSAAIARQQRVAVAQLAGQAFVRTARANGLSNSRILLRHAVPAALPSSISTIALLVPALFSGAVIVELLFSWPGVGSLLVQAINTRDYPLAAGATCLVGVATAFGVWLADALRWWSDPRSRVHAIHD